MEQSYQVNDTEGLAHLMDQEPWLGGLSGGLIRGAIARGSEYVVTLCGQHVQADWETFGIFDPEAVSALIEMGEISGVCGGCSSR